MILETIISSPKHGSVITCASQIASVFTLHSILGDFFFFGGKGEEEMSAPPRAHA